MISFYHVDSVLQHETVGCKGVKGNTQHVEVK